MILQPTHHCFDDALDYVELRVKADPSLVHLETLVLVHGIAVAPNGPHQGEIYAHAWVEEAGLCVDAGILDGQRVWYSVARDEYYDSLQVKHTTRYTLRQASIQNQMSGTYGPWEPAYIQLCAGRKPGRIYGAVDAQVGPSAVCENAPDLAKATS